MRWKAQGQQLRFEKTKYGFVANVNGSRGYRYEIIITSMIFELIQFRWFRKLRKGEYKLISPRFKEVGSFWTDSGYFYKEDEVIDVEIYTKRRKNASRF